MAAAGFRANAKGLNAITMQAESGGRRYGKGGRLLRSPVGAMGEMQVMPATAREPGFGIRPWQGGADDLARVGREYRAKMEQRYGGDYAKMWAAYNAGPGRVDSAVKRGGRNWLRFMPAETRAYVNKNMRALGRR